MLPSTVCFQLFEANSMLIGRRVAWAPAPCDLRVLGAVVALVGLRPADCREWLVLRGCVGHQPTLSCLASPVNSPGRELSLLLSSQRKVSVEKNQLIAWVRLVLSLLGGSFTG